MSDRQLPSLPFLFPPHRSAKTPPAALFDRTPAVGPIRTTASSLSAVPRSRLHPALPFAAIDVNVLGFLLLFILENFEGTPMKKHSRDQWLSLVKETEYALDHSGTMIFLSVLLIGAHLLNSPPYARVVFAVVLLLCLMPKTVCGFYRMKEPRRSECRLSARSISTRPLMPRPLDWGRWALILKAGLRRARIMAVAMAVTGVAVLFSALMFSTANALLDQHASIPAATMPPRLIGNYFLTGDQARLPMRGRLPEDQPVKAVLVAVHGFNDYSAFFEAPGNYFKESGIASYA